MIKIVSVEQMRAIEQATDAAGTSYDQMMQLAGRAVAEVVKLLLGENPSEKRVAVLVGPGNNGGDGLVAARILKEEVGAEVGCYLSRRRGDDDPVFKAAEAAGVFIAVSEDDQRWRVLKNLVANADVVIDALLGIGARLPVEGDLKKILQHSAAALERDRLPAEVVAWPAAPLQPPRPGPVVVAVDCPSGLNSDTGELDPAAISADITITFAAAKFGHLLLPGAEAVGELVVAPIGTPGDLPELVAITSELATGRGVAALLPKRPPTGHKGTFGRAVIVAGSVNYTGAAALAGFAAYRAGAGLVSLAVPQAIYPILAAQLPEATWLLLPHELGVINAAALDVFQEEVGDLDALLIGPGLGREEQTLRFMRGLLYGHDQASRGRIGFRGSQAVSAGENNDRRELPASLIIDADGLNLLSQIDDWWKTLPPETVLTPHPGEMARLTGFSREEILRDRFAVARKKAAEWNCVVVLKSAFTVVAAPDSRIVVSPFATDALATAGTGDVLAGLLVGLMAQGASPFDAAVAATYIHGLAGKLAGDAASTRSVLAGDVLRAVPAALALLEPPR